MRDRLQRPAAQVGFAGGNVQTRGVARVTGLGRSEWIGAALTLVSSAVLFVMDLNRWRPITLISLHKWLDSSLELARISHD